MTRRILAPITLFCVACVSGQTQDDGVGGSAPGGVAGAAGSSTIFGGAAGASTGGSAAGLGGAGGGFSGTPAIGGSMTAGGNPLGGAAGMNPNGGMSMGGAGGTPMGGMPMAGMAMGGMAMGGTGGAPMGGMGGTPMGGMGGTPMGGMGGAPMGGSGGASCVEMGRMVGMTAAHNAARAMEGANLKPLTWDCTVAAYAQSYANKLRDEQGCWNLVHSGGPYGENLYASGSKPNPPNQAPQAAVNSWYGEKKNYNYAANTCSGVCGHYTQVVWGSSERLGCGVATCPADPDGWLYEVWVCNYDPPGNFNGARPY